MSTTTAEQQPEAGTGDAERAEYAFLNEQQLRAVKETERPVLVLAPPGTGKTLVLQWKYLAFHDRHGPGSCAAITFSQNAAKEIKNRLRRQGVTMDARNPASEGYLNASYVGTFHSVGLKILQDAARLGLYAGPLVMIQGPDQDMLAFQCLQQGSDGTIGANGRTTEKTGKDVADLKSAVSRIKNTGWFPVKDGYGRPDGTFRKLMPGLPSPGGVQHARALAYHDALWNAQVLDFDDVLIQTTAVLAAHRDKVMPKLVAVIVDEFQDTNKAQGEMVREMSRGLHLTCCGDDDQALYAWRGARLENILQFEADYPDAVVITFDQNYRSKPEIIDAAENLISHNKLRKIKPKANAIKVSSEISEHMPITVHEYVSKYPLYSPASGGYEAGLVHFTAQVCRDLVQSGVGLGEIACLTRTNKTAREIQRVLNQMNMPARIANQDAVNSLELRRLTAWLRLLTNGTDSTAISTLCYCGSADAAFMDIARAAKQGRKPLADYIIERCDERKIKQKRFTDFAEAYKRFATPEYRSDPIGLISALCEYETTRPHASMNKTHHKQFWAIYASLVAMIQESNRLGAALDYLMNAASDSDVVEADAEAIEVSTAHSVKGRQKPHVVISAFADGIMPSSQAIRAGAMSNQMQEERRLAFVALTRAGECAHVITVQKAHSTFLGEMGALHQAPAAKDAVDAA